MQWKYNCWMEVFLNSLKNKLILKKKLVPVRLLVSISYSTVCSHCNLRFKLHFGVPTTTLWLLFNIRAHTVFFHCSSCLTCDVDLDLKAALLGDRHCGPLGDYPALDCLWHNSSYCTGHGTGTWICASVTRPALMMFGITGYLLSRLLQEVLYQLDPVKDEKDPEVIEDHCEAGRLTCGSVEREIIM